MADVIGIYSITHTASGRQYIGSSVCIYQRWRKHKQALKRGKHHSVYLQRAWNKYGADEFQFCIIEHCELEKLKEREQYFLDTCNPKFNGAKSANSPVLRGQKLPKEWVEKAAKKVRERYANGFVIKHPPRSAECRQKTAEIVKARWEDPDYRKKNTLSIALSMTAEECAKRSERTKLLWANPQYREKAIQARKGNAYSKGYKCTEAQRQNRKMAARISNMKRNYKENWKQEYIRRYPEHAGDLNGRA